MKKILFYGAGHTAHYAFFELSTRYEIVAFVDRDPAKIGQSLFDVPIVAPETAAELDFDIVVVTLAQFPHCLDPDTCWRGITPEEVVALLGVPLERIAYYSGHGEPRASVLSLCAKEISARNIDGDTAELGVYQGLFARCINACLPDKRLYLFDTFSGYDPVEIESSVRRGWKFAAETDFSNTSPESVLRRMKTPGNCIIRKGCFPQTVNGLESNRYCFVSIDANLREPTRAGLDYFVPRMVANGYIFMHDYYWNGPGIISTIIDEFEKENGVSFKKVPLNDGTLILCF